MTGSINPTLPVTGEPNSTADPKVLGSLKTLRDEINALLTSENLIEKTKLEKAAKPVNWYTPKVIAAEESRTNTAYGTLAAADEIKEVVLPTDGLLSVGYSALFKQSVANAARVAIFLNENQLKTFTDGVAAPATQAAHIQETINSYCLLTSYSGGLIGNKGGSQISGGATTGQALGMFSSGGIWNGVEVGGIQFNLTGAAYGLCSVFAVGGTYNVSVRFKASSGTVTAKERKLWVHTLGV